MNKLTLAFGTIAGLTAMLLVPSNLFTQNVANAASCSASSQSGSHHSSVNSPPSNTGSCGASSGAFGGKFASSGNVQSNVHSFPTPVPFTGNNGVGKSGACETRSAGSTGVNLNFDLGFGSSVSCSSHSP